MADDNGKLSADDKSRVIQWLEDKLGNGGPCPACGKTKWSLMEDMGSVPVYSGGAIFPPAVYPAIVLTCRNCGNMRLFNAVVVGVITPPGTEVISGSVVEPVPGGTPNAS